MSINFSMKACSLLFSLFSLSLELSLYDYDSSRGTEGREAKTAGSWD